MELRQLEYFVAVAEDRHFTRAAARMHVAQSGLAAPSWQVAVATSTGRHPAAAAKALLSRADLSPASLS